MNRMKRTALGLLLLSLAPCTFAQSRPMVVDATAQALPPVAVPATLGTYTNPAGHTLQANSQYLVRDGKPWLPVMGELHYSRVPPDQWEASILRMKSAGVDIIASYVIWIHHEQTEGQFEWTGQKDLRRFAELCAKHGMYLYPRIGPWAHAEVRNGGFPDWVVAGGHTRENDPQYLKSVATLYDGIGRQLKGLYWKDGGPIIGIQIENEYRATGPGKGVDHIRTLKQMALAAGMDVPLYTVTGWDGTSIPLDAVLPVFGGYPDAPWDSASNALPPPEVYAFRFDNRSAGNMGAIGGNGQGPADAYRGTPFLTAELGGGIQDTYFRRPVVSPDDIAAMLPVLLGSGANLLGYYMFVGGRNPDGGTITLQESQRTGYPTDVPVKSYDFQAPIGNNGEERVSLRRIKLVHDFLQDFGPLLAPMDVHRPAILPGDAQDLTVPRVAVRSKGDRGFVFFNNYVRNGTMPARNSFQVRIDLPQGRSVRVPQQPVALPSGAYGIWPVNLDLGGITLQYSTAQLFKQVVHGRDLYAYFFAIPGVSSEFLVGSPGRSIPVRSITESSFTQTQSPAGILLRADADSGEATIVQGNRTVHLVLLPRSRAENLWRLPASDTFLETTADVFSDGQTSTLRQERSPQFQYRLWRDGVIGWTVPAKSETRSVAPVALSVTADPVRPALSRLPFVPGPSVAWRKQPVVMAPEAEDFARAATWTLHVHSPANAPQLAEVLLRIRYQGDVGRLMQDGKLRDDDFWNGKSWSIGLNAAGVDPSRPLTLAVLPLPKTEPMYLQAKQTLDWKGNSQISDLLAAEAIPVYSLTLATQK